MKVLQEKRGAIKQQISNALERDVINLSHEEAHFMVMEGGWDLY